MKTVPPKDDRHGIQVISRAASILRAVEGEPSGLSLGDLAGRLGLARSTVQRIVSALIDEGFLISAGPRAGVTLGPTVTRLAAATVIDTEKMAHPILHELSVSVSETVDLSVLRRDHAVFVDQVTGKSRVVAISAVGESFPLHCTANGKALLSQLNDDRRERLLQGRLQRHTPRTVTNRASLYEEIAEAQRSGLAWDLEEHSLGICAVGSSFIDPVGRFFALSIPVPTARFAAKRKDLGIAIIRARDSIVKLIPGASVAVRAAAHG